MNKLLDYIILTQFTKTVVSSALIALAVYTLQNTLTTLGFLQGITEFVLALLVIIAIDIYSYKYERDSDKDIEEINEKLTQLLEDKK